LILVYIKDIKSWLGIQLFLKSNLPKTEEFFSFSFSFKDTYLVSEIATFTTNIFSRFGLLKNLIFLHYKVSVSNKIALKQHRSALKQHRHKGMSCLFRLQGMTSPNRHALKQHRHVLKQHRHVLKQHRHALEQHRHV
jgi:hypothetical protein